MDVLASQLERYGHATRPVEKSRHALLSALVSICTFSDKIQKSLGDKESINEFLDKCLTGKPKMLSDLYKISDSNEDIKTALTEAKEAEEKRLERKAKREKALAEEAKQVVPVVPVFPTFGSLSNVFNFTIDLGGGGGGGGGAGLGVGLVPAEDPVAPVLPITKAPRLKDKVAKPKKAKIGSGLKEAVWDRCVGSDCAKIKCPVCQIRDIRMTDFAAGHVQAERLGGETSIDNLVPICGKCNSCMATENLNDYCARVFKRGIVLPKGR
jgi:hypothetical protein